MTPSEFFSTIFDGTKYLVNVRAIGGGNVVSDFIRPEDVLPFAQRFKDRNVYFSCATRDGGGKKEHIRAIPVLWTDIDFKSITPEEADRLIKEFHLPPSFTILSGGGYHLYWRLKELVGQGDILRVESILRGLAKVLKGDPGATDASRVMRVPGSFNVKPEYGDPRLVQIVQANPERRYALSDFDYLAEESTTHTSKSSPDIQAWVERCAFLQRWERDAATLSEPEWYAGMSILARWPGGVDYIHQVSSRYPGYSRKETEEKILRSLNEGGPRTCAAIKQLMDCGKDCGVTSPYVLQLKMQQEEVPNDALILDPKDHMENARRFREKYYTTLEGVSTLHHWNMNFYEWDGTHHPEAEEAGIKSKAYQFLGGAVNNSGTPLKPNRNSVADTIGALQAQTYLPASFKSPGWIGGVETIPADQFISFANGILHTPIRGLRPHSPLFFTQYALQYPYDPDTGPPKEMQKFLQDLWSDDVESQYCLQEIFGYFVAGGTDHHKIFLIVGPKRSGKGTIARVITGLLGNVNVCAPTLASLNQNFGLAPLIGKRAAIIADARISGRADQTAVAERLLAISGEDNLTIDRKFKKGWTGQLHTRFLLLTNELPRLADASGALASRFVPLVLKSSFYGKEDLTLTGKLLKELPAILNWSLDGWDRLRERGHFLIPSASMDVIRELEALSSPVGEFLKDATEEEAPDQEVEHTILFWAWRIWCVDHGRQHPGTIETFGRDLRAVRPNIGSIRRREGDKRVRVYTGVTLNKDWTERAKRVRASSNPDWEVPF